MHQVQGQRWAPTPVSFILSVGSQSQKYNSVSPVWRGNLAFLRALLQSCALLTFPPPPLNTTVDAHDINHVDQCKRTSESFCTDVNKISQIKLDSSINLRQALKI